MMEAPMATDPGEVAKIYMSDLREAADFIERQDIEITALREKLEAAEAQCARADKIIAAGSRALTEAEAALTEARAAQAAAWDAGKMAMWGVAYEARRSVTWLDELHGAVVALTPPADLSAALQRVRDEAWEQAAKVCEGDGQADYISGGDEHADHIRALRRAPTEGEG